MDNRCLSKGEREKQGGCDLPGVAKEGKVAGSTVSGQLPNAYQTLGIMGQKEWGHKRRTERES